SSGNSNTSLPWKAVTMQWETSHDRRHCLGLGDRRTVSPGPGTTPDRYRRHRRRSDGTPCTGTAAESWYTGALDWRAGAELRGATTTPRPQDRDRSVRAGLTGSPASSELDPARLRGVG